MTGFQHFSRDALDLEREIEKYGVVLGLDWGDSRAMRQLAREALDGGAAHINALLRDPDPQLRARGGLFALAVLMLRTMQGSAASGIHTHGGVAWKAFGRALIEEADVHPAAGL